MNDSLHSRTEPGPSQRGVEIGVAVVIALFAIIGIVGSIEVGAGWVDGPQAGFFPFYVCVILLLSCVVNLASVLRHDWEGARFVSWRQARQVMAVVVPTTLYVFAIPAIGIYVSSILLIGVFMKWLGSYRWPRVLIVAVGVPVLIFIIFEYWFLVPLPKGPLEDMLGL